MDPRLYWLALSRIEHLGDARCKSLLAVFPSPQTIFARKASELAEVPGIPVPLAERIASFSWKTHLPELERELEQAERRGARLVTQSDSEYPSSFKNIPDPPVYFY